MRLEAASRSRHHSGTFIQHRYFALCHRCAFVDEACEQSLCPVCWSPLILEKAGNATLLTEPLRGNRPLLPGVDAPPPPIVRTRSRVASTPPDAPPTTESQALRSEETGRGFWITLTISAFAAGTALGIAYLGSLT